MSQPYPPVYPPARRLERSRTDRFLGGVCGGAAKYLNMDPALVRILTVVLAFVSFGVTALVYVVLLFALPEEQLSPPPQVRPGGPQQGFDPYGPEHQHPGRPAPDPVWGTGGAPWEQPAPPRPQDTAS